jgi:hypothetical protein
MQHELTPLQTKAAQLFRDSRRGLRSSTIYICTLPARPKSPWHPDLNMLRLVGGSHIQHEPAMRNHRMHPVRPQTTFDSATATRRLNCRWGCRRATAHRAPWIWSVYHSNSAAIRLAIAARFGSLLATGCGAPCSGGSKSATETWSRSFRGPAGVEQMILRTNGRGLVAASSPPTNIRIRPTFRSQTAATQESNERLTCRAAKVYNFRRDGRRL